MRSAEHPSDLFGTIDITNRKKAKLDKIIRIMNMVLYEADPSSACETYIGHARDMLKEFRDEEL